jgi:hypothetical protein
MLSKNRISLARHLYLETGKPRRQDRIRVTKLRPGFETNYLPPFQHLQSRSRGAIRTWRCTPILHTPARIRRGGCVAERAFEIKSDSPLREKIRQPSLGELAYRCANACDSYPVAVLFVKLGSVYLSFLRKCGLLLANGIGSILCLGTASVAAGFMYGETSTARAFSLLFIILAFLSGGFYLFLRFLKVISPKRRVERFPTVGAPRKRP